MILYLKKRPAAQTAKNPHFFQGFLNLPQQLLLSGLKNCQNRFKVDAPRLDRFPLILFRAVGRSKNLKGAIRNVQCLLIEQIEQLLTVVLILVGMTFFSWKPGSHQNLVPSMNLNKFWLIFMRMKQKNGVFLKKKNSKWPTHKNFANSQYFFAKILGIGPWDSRINW